MKWVILKRFIPIFFAVFIISVLSIDSFYYEDGIYLNYAISIVQDLDFNLINQMPREFSPIVTRRFSPPTHHAVIQTPLILVGDFLDKFISSTLTPGKSIPSQFAGVFVSIICLVLGWFYSQRAAACLNVAIKKRHFFAFLVASSLSYFAFFSLTVMEVFTFALSSFCFYSLVLLSQKKYSNVGFFSVGLTAAMLLVAKITFFPLFLGISFYALGNGVGLRSKRAFVCGSAIIFISAIIKDFATFGEVVLISRAMNEFTTSYRFINIMQTFSIGLWGEGGLFYSNPIYLFGFLGFVIFSFMKMKKEIETRVLYCTLLVWLLMSFFQTIFVVGPMLEDHLVGRLTLMALPLMIIGIAHLDKILNFKNHQFLKVPLILSASLLHLYALFNFLALSETGHYSYAKTKTLGSWQALGNYFTSFSFNIWNRFEADYLRVIFFALILSLLVYLIIYSRNRLDLYFKSYIYSATAFMAVFCSIDLLNSSAHGQAYLESNGLMEQVSIADHYTSYSFNYITDILRSQYYNTNNEELRQLILEKHRQYLRRTRFHLQKVTPALEQALKNEDLNYGYFQSLEK